MTTITPTGTRIHPLVAAAAVSLIVVSMVGTAAIAGWLPRSHSETSAPVAAVTALAAPTPVPVAVHAAAQHHRPQQVAQVREERYNQPQQVAQVREERYNQQPQAVAVAQPNYLGISAGALIGGLLGNRVGGGNGRALATLAGAVGGGFVGNAMQNQAQR